MKTAFAYLRVSSSGQVNGDGFDRQHFAVAQFAAARGYDSVTYFREEAVPGKTEIRDRPAYLEMVQSALDNAVQTIFVERMDRLAREFRVQELILTHLACHSIDLIAADTGENVTEAFRGDPMRRAMIQIQGIFAELEKNMIVSKLFKARKRARDRGERCEGQPPYGFKTYKEKGKPIMLVRVDAEQYVIEQILLMRDQGSSLQTISGALIAHGFKTRHGKAWTPVQVQRIITRHQNMQK